MDARTFMSLKFLFQSVSVVLSFAINSFLIYLIIAKSPAKMGNYRVLMVYFCISAIFFSLMDIVVQPSLHTFKSAFFIVMEYKSLGIPKWLAEILTSMMCGCFAITIFGIAIHFIYRLFALERKGRIRYFQQGYLLIWLFVPLIGGFLWFSISYFLFSMEPVKTEYIRNSTKEYFDLDLDDCVYSAAVFYPIDENGNKFSHSKSFLGFASFLFVMSIPFTVVMVAGGKSYLIIRELKNQGDTSFSKNLQLQLYKALVAQFAIPVFLLFIPFGAVFILPLFEVNCQFLSMPITFIYALYPVVDPLPIYFFVDYYRNFMKKCFKRWRSF